MRKRARSLATEAERVALAAGSGGPVVPGSTSGLSYRYAFVDGPFDVIVTTEGKANLAQFMEGERRLLSDPRYRGGLNLLYDHSRVDLSSLDGDDVGAVAAADRSVEPEARAAACGKTCLRLPRRRRGPPWSVQSRKHTHGSPATPH